MPSEKTLPPFTEVTTYFKDYKNFIDNNTKMDEIEQQKFWAIEEKFSKQFNFEDGTEIRNLIIQLQRSGILDEKFYQQLDRRYRYIAQCLLPLNDTGVRFTQSDIHTLAKMFSQPRIDQYKAAWQVSRVLEFAAQANALKQENYVLIIMHVYVALTRSPKINIPNTLNWLHLAGILNQDNFVKIINAYTQANADTTILDNLDHIGSVLRRVIDIDLEIETRDQLIPLLFSHSKKISSALDDLETLVESKLIDYKKTDPVSLKTTDDLETPLVYRKSDLQAVNETRRKFFREVVKAPHRASEITHQYWQEAARHKDARIGIISQAKYIRITRYERRYAPLLKKKEEKSEKHSVNLFNNNGKRPAPLTPERSTKKAKLVM